ncbi:MAG: ABC transporter substrate-binding protein, partial [Bryobacteraceae bacterium]|nr:ABC transporter substrate-binding protein [Bryobacteraceae bacterium]
LTLIAVLATVAFGQERIVSTSPAITETLYALGAGTRVVGVSAYCRYPQDAVTKPKVGSWLRPNTEVIVRLNPDLVIVERLPNQFLERLKGSGIRVETVVIGDVNANLKLIESIATATRTQERGAQVIKNIRDSLNRIEVDARPLKRRSVIFVVGRTPGRLEGMVAVGKGSYLNELLAIAGGQNLLSNSALAYPKVSLEAIVRLQPDVIIDMGDMAQTEGVSEDHKKSVIQLWKSRPEITARVHAVADDIFVVPGPRMVEAASTFKKLIHGDRPR